MTLARTALRLQAVRTLLADPVIDRMCEGRIYDSRIGDFDQFEPVPTIIVTTEEDDAPAWSTNNGGVPFNHVCDLVLEVAMTVAVERDDKIYVGKPETDSELEAQLDLIEECAVQALSAGGTDEARLLRRVVTRKISRTKSSRFATDDGVRLAVRLVTLTTHLKDEGEVDVRDVPTGPFAGLPEPLRSVAEAMPEDYSGRVTCVKLAELMPAPEALPTDPYFRGVDAIYAPRRLSPDEAVDFEAEIAAGHTFGHNYETPAP